MSHSLPFLYLARVTLECRSPLSIGSHLHDPRYDTPIARDANRLPAIPGSTIAGTLRHLRDKELGVDVTSRLFGWTADDFANLSKLEENERREADAVYQASRLHFSWAHIHNAQDQPIDGLVIEADSIQQIEQDPILRLALETSPMTRDHVSLTERGAAEHRKKFDRSCLPPGHRFTFEMRFSSNRADDPDWLALKQLLASPRWRLGGATRRGYGKVDVIRFKEACFDLRSRNDYKRFQQIPRQLDATVPEGVLEDWVPDATAEVITARLDMEAEDFIRFGQGDRLLGENRKHAIDLLPLTTPKVVWIKKDGREQAELSQSDFALMPASAIKGAIRHRFLFHLRRNGGCDRAGSEIGDDEFSALRDEFFGSANDDENGEEHGKAGHLIIDDTLVPLSKDAYGIQIHNSIDRFTGGVRQGALYGEQMLYQPRFDIGMMVERIPDMKKEAQSQLQEALKLTINDLCRGRLALGAGSSKGHGYCRGHIQPGNNEAETWFGRPEGDHASGA